MWSVVPQLKTIIIVRCAVYEQKSRDFVCYTPCIIWYISACLLCMLAGSLNVKCHIHIVEHACYAKCTTV